MSKFLGTPKVQYFDSSGNPLSGGKLYAYEVGTTTLKNTYPTIADANAETNANANPVILNARGEANVIIKGSTKLVLKDSSDSLIWTVDNITENIEILDSNGNLLLDTSSVSSAVNYIKITNAATGDSPILGVDGEDTNIDLTIEATNTGDIIVDNSSIQFDDNEGIKDSSRNFIISFQKATTAVNYLTISNSATGTSPKITSTGTDADIGMNFQAKGSGTYNFLGTSSQEAEIRLYEDTDNGTNYVALKAPSSISTNRTLTFPDLSGSLGVRSTQSAVEAETDESSFVSPDLVKHTPGAPKAWGYSDGSGNLGTNYGISGVVRNSAGNYTVSWDTEFASANYVVIATTNTSNPHAAKIVSTAAGSCVIGVFNTANNVAIDDPFYVVAYGTQ